jgi:hypothetical protein
VLSPILHSILKTISVSGSFRRFFNSLLGIAHRSVVTCRCLIHIAGWGRTNSGRES